MKCPKCGSEHVQFMTTSSSRGFSFSNSCCGYMLLGPLGLLCGTIGSGTHTEEFWICHECGHKFTTGDVNRIQAEEKSRKAKQDADRATSLQYMQELSALEATEGDYATIRERAIKATQQREQAKANEDNFVKGLKDSNDQDVKKLAMKARLSDKPAILWSVVGLLGAGILLAFQDLSMGAFLFVPGIILFCVVAYLESTAIEELKGRCEEFKQLAEATTAAKAEEQRLKALVKKIDFVASHPIDQ